MEETSVADGPPPKPGLLSNHVSGSHGVPALGELGCTRVELRGPTQIEIIGSEEVEESGLVWGRRERAGFVELSFVTCPAQASDNLIRQRTMAAVSL